MTAPICGISNSRYVDRRKDLHALTGAQNSTRGARPALRRSDVAALNVSAIAGVDLAVARDRRWPIVQRGIRDRACRGARVWPCEDHSEPAHSRSGRGHRDFGHLSAQPQPHVPRLVARPHRMGGVALTHSAADSAPLLRTVHEPVPN